MFVMTIIVRPEDGTEMHCRREINSVNGLNQLRSAMIF